MPPKEQLTKAQTELSSLKKQRLALQKEKSLLTSGSEPFQAKQQEIITIQKQVIETFKTIIPLKQKMQKEKTTALKNSLEEDKKQIKELLLKLKSNQHESFPQLCEQIATLHSRIEEANEPFDDFGGPAANFSGENAKTILKYLYPKYCSKVQPDSSPTSNNSIAAQLSLGLNLDSAKSGKEKDPEFLEHSPRFNG